MVSINSKKFFYKVLLEYPVNLSRLSNGIDQVHPSFLPNKDLLKNPKLIDLTVEALACLIPKSKVLMPKKLQAKLSKINFVEEVFQEIIDYVKGKGTLDLEGIKLVKFLEQEAITYVGNWIDARKTSANWIQKEDIDEDLLSNLRNKSLKGVSNTCCYYCGRVLERHSSIKTNVSYTKIDSREIQLMSLTASNAHFCSKRENPECFKKRKKIDKQEKDEWKFILSNQKCLKCGRIINASINLKENYFYRDKQFCSRNCYDNYRQKQSRINKALKTHTTSSL